MSSQNTAKHKFSSVSSEYQSVFYDCIFTHQSFLTQIFVPSKKSFLIKMQQRKFRKLNIEVPVQPL